ncbi:MAG: PIN domain-containing protein [Acidobacteriota bacterium]|nr:PIN domain-containing protein [Acidobacteriota bacterium]
MNLLVDTSVWSLALRRDRPPGEPAVRFLSSALAGGDPIFTTGLVLQELLQGFAGPPARDAILDRFAAIPFLVPDRHDHVQAADLRNACRRHGAQVGTIDALLAQLCLRHGLTLLTTDRDFTRIAEVRPFDLWQPPPAK